LRGILPAQIASEVSTVQAQQHRQILEAVTATVNWILRKGREQVGK